MLVSVFLNSYSPISWLESMLGYEGPNIQSLGYKVLLWDWGLCCGTARYWSFTHSRCFCHKQLSNSKNCHRIVDLTSIKCDDVNIGEFLERSY